MHKPLHRKYEEFLGTKQQEYEDKDINLEMKYCLFYSFFLLFTLNLFRYHISPSIIFTEFRYNKTFITL
jgi:hypothetical protein